MIAHLMIVAQVTQEAQVIKRIIDFWYSPIGFAIALLLVLIGLNVLSLIFLKGSLKGI